MNDTQYGVRFLEAKDVILMKDLKAAESYARDMLALGESCEVVKVVTVALYRAKG